MRILVLLVAATLVAGCSDAPPAVDETSDVPAPRDVQVGKDTGAISGVVVDLTIMPIAGATISVVGAQMVVQTDEGGTFVIEDLLPGPYFLNVSAPGHAPIQSQALVEAGQVSKVRVILQAVVTIEPVHETLSFQGYIEFSPGIIGIEANIILGMLGQDDPLCECNLFFSTAGQNVTTFVVEAFWTPSISEPGPVCPNCLYFSFADIEFNGANTGYKPSPIYEAMERDRFPEASVDWKAALTGDFDWVNYDQSYEMFVTIFQNAPAPDGWSLVAGKE